VYAQSTISFGLTAPRCQHRHPTTRIASYWVGTGLNHEGFLVIAFPHSLSRSVLLFLICFAFSVDNHLRGASSLKLSFGNPIILRFFPLLFVFPPPFSSPSSATGPLFFLSAIPSFLPPPFLSKKGDKKISPRGPLLPSFSSRFWRFWIKPLGSPPFYRKFNEALIAYFACPHSVYVLFSEWNVVFGSSCRVARGA